MWTALDGSRKNVTHAPTCGELSNELDFTLSPNPANDVMTILRNSQLQGKVDLSMYSAFGSLILEPKGIGINSIDIQCLVDGIYFVNVRFDGMNFTSKLIVSR